MFSFLKVFQIMARGLNSNFIRPGNVKALVGIQMQKENPASFEPFLLH